MTAIATGFADYPSFAQAVLADGWLSDPWVDGQPRLRPQPLALSADRLAGAAAAAEAVAALLDELVRLCVRQPQWLDWLGLSPWQKALFWSAAPAWHGFARADVFALRRGGWVVCEINSDTPSGLAEAEVLGRLCTADHNLNRNLLTRWAALIGACAPRGALDRGAPPTVGLVWPTEIGEDLPQILLWQQALEAAGWRTVRGSPFNLQAAVDGRVALLGVPCDVIVRHYKTDWLAERRPAWSDEPDPSDARPLAEPLRALLAAQLAGRTAVVNPLGAVVAQNKRLYALAWHLQEQEPQTLSADARAAVERWVPWSARLEDMQRQRLVAEQAQWVLKSDYGCEGEEVVLGARTAPETWQRALDQAVRGRWIAQQHFEAESASDGEVANLGIFLIAGRSAGAIARLSARATDRTAHMAAVAATSLGEVQA